jgi:hypothetical protein
MIEMLRNPPNGFEDAVREHFLLKGKYIVHQIQGWIDDSERFQDAAAHRTTLKQLLSEFLMELSRLGVQETEEKEENKGESKVGRGGSGALPEREKTAEEMQNEHSAMECTVMISNYKGSEKEVCEQFAVCGAIESVKFPSVFVTEIKFRTKAAAVSCVNMNGTTVRKNKLNVKKKSDMAAFLFQDGTEVRPVPEAATRENYEYHQYPF